MQHAVTVEACLIETQELRLSFPRPALANRSYPRNRLATQCTPLVSLSLLFDRFLEVFKFACFRYDKIKDRFDLPKQSGSIRLAEGKLLIALKYAQSRTMCLESKSIIISSPSFSGTSRPRSRYGFCALRKAVTNSSHSIAASLNSAPEPKSTQAPNCWRSDDVLKSLMSNFI